VTPPVVPNVQPKVITPPAEKILPPPNSVAPQGATPPSPGKTQPPPGATPFVPVPGMAPGKSLQPQGAPIAPAPKNSATPAPAPSNAQVPDTGFKRRSTTGPGARAPGAPPERAALPKAPAPQGAQPNFSLKFTPGFAPAGQGALRLQDLQKSRTQHTEEGGRRTVIEEPDNRVIVRQDNRVFVRHDETLRLATRARDVHSQRRSDGTTETVIIRPGGVLIYNVVDGGGRLIRRYRRDGRGREINIIDNRRFYEGAAAGLAIAAGVGIAAEVMGLHLGPPRIGIPREKYIVDYDRASDDDIDEALTAPPLEPLERGYSLEEIRYNVELRDRMRRIDLDTISFDFGAWDVTPDQYGVLARIAAGINRAVDRNPGEVFLIEGYTDAVGSDIDNLSLSDRRAQAVAEVLTEDFDVPPENLVTQGYGEEYLKIPTDGPERANRRVAVRRITPLLAQQDDR
jgi:outer membrane protein OmpA-like peptidoglycan-associated protein